jgi:hypothetical protein
MTEHHMIKWLQEKYYNKYPLDLNKYDHRSKLVQLQFQYVIKWFNTN